MSALQQVSPLYHKVNSLQLPHNTNWTARQHEMPGNSYIFVILDCNEVYTTTTLHQSTRLRLSLYYTLPAVRRLPVCWYARSTCDNMRTLCADTIWSTMSSSWINLHVAIERKPNATWSAGMPVLNWTSSTYIKTDAISEQYYVLRNDTERQHYTNCEPWWHHRRRRRAVSQ